MKTVFIVDDDVAILEVLKIVFEEEGMEVLTDTGDRTLQIVESNQPDVVILDIWMRGLDGRDLSRAIKQRPESSQLPVILMSAHSHANSVVEEAQADAFVEKPFDIDSMLDVVKRYL